MQAGSRMAKDIGGRCMKVFRLFLMIGLIVGLPIGFQNCGAPNSLKKSDESSSAAEKAGFAYSASFDQVAYMSCSDQKANTYDRSAYFTFRLGAYRNGGLDFSDTFFDDLDVKTQRQLKTDLDKVNFVGESPLNNKTELQISVRGRQNFQSVFPPGAVAGQDYQNIMSELGTKQMTELLMAQPPTARLRYMRNGFAEGNRFEGDIHMNTSVGLQTQLRALLASDFMIALTYADAAAGSPTYARGPAAILQDVPDETKSVFGKGYNIRFRQPTPASGTLYGEFPNHVLYEVEEVNLEDREEKSDIKAWTCPTKYQFRIVRPGDLGKDGVGCFAVNDPATLTADLAIVRKSLRVEDWYVDMTRKCIVPKKTQGVECYGGVDVVNTIQYDSSKFCRTDTKDGQCLHYASICVRNP